MRAVTASKIASGVFHKANAYRFCLHFAPLDPRKHTTMNHNPNNMYMDLWDYGVYPDWVHNCSQAPRTYEAQVVDIIAKTLSEQSGTNVTAEVVNANRKRTWSKFLTKDVKTSRAFHEIYPSVLGKLAEGIFIKESRLTWILEQQVRFDFTMNSLDNESPVTVGDFINRYNEDIEYVVSASNFGFAAEIDQAESALQKHERQQHTLYEPGVQELKKLDKEHDNFINRFMAFIH